MLPTGASGMKYIDEITCIFNLWVNDTTNELVALKAVQMMPALLLQEPIMSSKSKYYLEKLTELLSIWNEGRIDELLYQSIYLSKKDILKKTQMYKCYREVLAYSSAFMRRVGYINSC